MISNESEIACDLQDHDNGNYTPLLDNSTKDAVNLPTQQNYSGNPWVTCFTNPWHTQNEDAQDPGYADLDSLDDNGIKENTTEEPDSANLDSLNDGSIEKYI